MEAAGSVMEDGNVRAVAEQQGALDDLTRPIIGIENRTAQEVFDIMCDRFRRSSPSQVAPANPAQVTDAMVEAASAKYREIGARCNWQHSWPSEEAFHEILTAAIGAGGQAVADDAGAKLVKAMWGVDLVPSTLSQPHPADERVVEALPRPDAVAMTCGTICLEYLDRDERDLAYDWLEAHGAGAAKEGR